MKRWHATVTIRGPRFWLTPVELDVLASGAGMAVKRAVVIALPRRTHVRGISVRLELIGTIKKITTVEQEAERSREALRDAEQRSNEFEPRRH